MSTTPALLPLPAVPGASAWGVGGQHRRLHCGVCHLLLFPGLAVGTGHSTSTCTGSYLCDRLVGGVRGSSSDRGLCKAPQEWNLTYVLGADDPCRPLDADDADDSKLSSLSKSLSEAEQHSPRVWASPNLGLWHSKPSTHTGIPTAYRQWTQPSPPGRCRPLGPGMGCPCPRSPTGRVSSGLLFGEGPGAMRKRILAPKLNSANSFTQQTNFLMPRKALLVFTNKPAAKETRFLALQTKP
ncbi:UNVERIFIED_CONTAM: hypothetical protein K2H54_055435 [Gekko kuhli]